MFYPGSYVMKFIWHFLSMALFLLISVSCITIVESTPTPAPSATSTPTPSPSPTSTPLPSLAPAGFTLPTPRVGPTDLGRDISEMEGTVFVSDSGEFSLILPSGWEEDTEFGRRVMNEGSNLGFGSAVDFAGGRPTGSTFEPFIVIISEPVPSRTTLEEAIEDILTYSIEDISAEIVDRQLTSISEQPAEIVWLDVPPDAFLPSGYSLIQIYLIMDSRLILLQCSGVGQTSADRDNLNDCRNALSSLQFIR